MLVILILICVGKGGYAKHSLEFLPGKMQDLGEFVADENMDIFWTVRNVSKDTVRVASVKSSCGCVVPYIRDRVIPPGGETEIKARFSAKGRVGLQRKNLTVSTVDYEEVYVLEFKVKLLSSWGGLEGLDKQIDLGNIKPGQRVKLFLKVPEKYEDRVFFLDSLEYTHLWGKPELWMIPELSCPNRKMIAGREIEIEVYFPETQGDHGAWHNGEQEGDYELKFTRKDLHTNQPGGSTQYLNLKWKIIHGIDRK